MDNTERNVLAFACGAFAVQHIVRSPGFLQSLCSEANCPLERLLYCLKGGSSRRSRVQDAKDDDAIEQAMAAEVASATLKHRLRYSHLFFLFSAWLHTTYCGVKAIHFASGAETRRVWGWAPWLIGATACSLAAYVDLRQWHIDVVYSTVMFCIGLYQRTFVFEHEYFGFSGITAAVCFAFGITQDHTSKALLGNVMVYAFRMSALPWYLPERGPTSTMTQAEVNGAFVDTILHEMILLVLISTTLVLLDQGGKSFLLEQISRAELNVELACVHNLLASFCDCVVKLDGAFRIREDSPKLGALLLTAGRSLRSQEIRSYIAERDRHRFLEFIAAASKATEETRMAQALHVDLLDSACLPVAVKAFVVPVRGIGGTTHLLGICETGDEQERRKTDEPPAAVTMAAVTSDPADALSDLTLVLPPAIVTKIDLLLGRSSDGFTLEGYIVHFPKANEGGPTVQVDNLMENIEASVFERWLQGLVVEGEDAAKPTSAGLTLPHLGRVSSDRVRGYAHAEPEVIQVTFTSPSLHEKKRYQRDRLIGQFQSPMSPPPLDTSTTVPGKPSENTDNTAFISVVP
eukprot:TRINITY_DN25920_c0_g1_i1.p1 TRINITY_DN25920_c0_g1~~TRINITY_DN25920_c0_g1_i1.p1  ORF type:complete len:575 (+),score=99.05 TRINITY_DN25920_c0_g1_i1:142-1866(+)